MTEITYFDSDEDVQMCFFLTCMIVSGSSIGTREDPMYSDKVNFVCYKLIMSHKANGLSFNKLAKNEAG